MVPSWIHRERWRLTSARLVCEDHRKDVICFTHPGVGSHTFPVSLFVRVSRFQVFLRALQEAGRV